MYFIEKYFWIFSVFLLPVLYLLVTSAFYVLFFVWKKKEYVRSKIQVQHASALELKRELVYGFSSLLIFAGMGCLVFLLHRYNISAIYFDISDFSAVYFFLSIVLMILFHDMYFYWTHRLLHLPGWYQKIHSIHHLSSNPSPFTSLSFHPVESIIQALVLPLIVIIIPAHPVAIFLFLIYMVYKNVRGHTGYEFTTNAQRENKWNKIHNYSIHHNAHHLNGRDNYGLYFTIWDRLMRTFKP